MKRLLLWFIMIAVCACARVERAALPAPSLLSPDVAQTNVQSSRRVDHAAWAGFLNRYVAQDANGINRVDYGAVSDADRNELRRYLSDLQRVEVSSLNRDEQLAFWINLYNAVTVNVVLEHYPVASIRKINDGFLSFGPWDRPLVTVEGRSLSLNDIEHRIIRPVFAEPRIHYALNCAAAGCPNLMSRPWRANTLEADLTQAERAYVNDPRGVSVGPHGVILSKIYIWFQEDFGADEAAVLDRLRSVAGPELATALQGKTRVARYIYDWSLNDTVPARP
ncbi:DUF547 domain-containing protein [Epibacterium sp. SM1979]|uniref:DUF547 domain-containing protein n=1 Tax=Tritonibacter litoralis TaxID=2662264 RepID=A0A843YKT1_9RHOB|nr:DUF547 domain-containing protein [Tritonibacter litoralis]MQQ09297.1 DUF547 domain-containing protein [Tritonibacter litoralis]